MDAVVSSMSLHLHRALTAHEASDLSVDMTVPSVTRIRLT